MSHTTLPTRAPQSPQPSPTDAAPASRWRAWLRSRPARVTVAVGATFAVLAAGVAFTATGHGPAAGMLRAENGTQPEDVLSTNVVALWRVNTTPSPAWASATPSRGLLNAMNAAHPNTVTGPVDNQGTPANDVWSHTSFGSGVTGAAVVTTSTGPETIAVTVVTDLNAAAEQLPPLGISHGLTYELSGDVLLTGSRAALDAAVTGDKLGTDAAFTAATNPLPAARVGLVYVNPKKATGAARTVLADAIPLFGTYLTNPAGFGNANAVTAAIVPDGDSIHLYGHTDTTPDPTDTTITGVAEQLAGIPANTVTVFAGTGLAHTVDSQWDAMAAADPAGIAATLKNANITKPAATAMLGTNSSLITTTTGKNRAGFLYRANARVGVDAFAAAQALVTSGKWTDVLPDLPYSVPSGAPLVTADSGSVTVASSLSMLADQPAGTNPAYDLVMPDLAGAHTAYYQDITATTTLDKAEGDLPDQRLAVGAVAYLNGNFTVTAGHATVPPAIAEGPAARDNSSGARADADPDDSNTVGAPTSGTVAFPGDMSVDPKSVPPLPAGLAAVGDLPVWGDIGDDEKVNDAIWNQFFTDAQTAHALTKSWPAAYQALDAPWWDYAYRAYTDADRWRDFHTVRNNAVAARAYIQRTRVAHWWLNQMYVWDDMAAKQALYDEATNKVGMNAAKLAEINKAWETLTRRGPDGVTELSPLLASYVTAPYNDRAVMEYVSARMPTDSVKDLVDATNLLTAASEGK